MFSIAKKRKKIYCVIFGKYRKFKKPKIVYLLEKVLALSTIFSICKNKDKNYLNKKNQLRY